MAFLVVGGTIITASATPASAGGANGPWKASSPSTLRSTMGGPAPAHNLRDDRAAIATRADPAPVHWRHGPHPWSAGINSGAQSTNWSGEIATDTTFTGIQGEWVVPTVRPSSSPEYSSTWVGIDGVTNTSLIQGGTEQDSGGGTATYFAWYEILPAAEVPIREPVSPGNVMNVSVTEQSAGTWEIIITDVTANWSTSGAFAYHGPGTSAEWIEEAPTVNNAQSTLANFGSMGFSHMATSSSGSGSSALTPVSMVNTNGVVIAYPGPFNASTDSFPITFGTPPVLTSSTSLHITTLSLPSGAPKASYSASLAATGGNHPYRWSVSAGKLPTGLHLRATTGVISGKPKKTDSGTSAFTVTVVDKKIKTKGHPATRQTATKVLSIKVS